MGRACLTLAVRQTARVGAVQCFSVARANVPCCRVLVDLGIPAAARSVAHDSPALVPSTHQVSGHRVPARQVRRTCSGRAGRQVVSVVRGFLPFRDFGSFAPSKRFSYDCVGLDCSTSCISGQAGLDISLNDIGLAATSGTRSGSGHTAARKCFLMTHCVTQQTFAIFMKTELW